MPSTGSTRCSSGNSLVDCGNPRTAYPREVQNEVDRYVDAVEPAWQREVCVQLLEDIRASAHLGEHIKWSHPYFEYEGDAVLKWFCARNWINVYFFRGRELPDPNGLFEQSDNQRMLTIKVRDIDDLDRSAFRDLVHAAVLLAGNG